MKRTRRVPPLSLRQRLAQREAELVFLATGHTLSFWNTAFRIDRLTRFPSADIRARLKRVEYDISARRVEEKT